MKAKALRETAVPFSFVISLWCHWSFQWSTLYACAKSLCQDIDDENKVAGNQYVS
ncbi:hypothetical protein [Mucilaginibacter flavidus]|uniref:hypothetical protein n=1 Tax=Mucilaginibacter flavidus TaxID=2949309 RepID=UPI0020934564|nr:hypothetical protein [Mucilaginibacter flavidus]MCO5948652.1 hypothetical protein [Mucilaginibacter flavidus]